MEFPAAFIVATGVVLVLEFIFGLSLNIMVLLVYHVTSQSTKRDNNIFITNLNIADILICVIAIPTTLYMSLTSRNHSVILCFFHEGVISFVSSTSAINLLIISIDRYEAVATPMRRKLSGSRSKYIILIAWTLSMIGFTFPFYGISLDKINAVNANDTLSTCKLSIEASSLVYLFELFYCLMFCISITGMLFCYYKIFKVAQDRLAARSAFVQVSMTVADQMIMDSHKKNQERRVTSVSLSIVLAFILCWGPHVVITVVQNEFPQNMTVDMLEVSFLLLAYSTTVLHPILYVFMRANFREIIKVKWCCCKKTRHSATISPRLSNERRQSTINSRRPDGAGNNWATAVK